MKVRDIIREVEAQGWYYVRTRRDHRIYHHVTRGGRVVISGHPHDDVKPGMLAGIRREARGQ